MASSAPQDFGQPLILEDFIPITQPVTAASPPLCAVCHKAVTISQRCKACVNIYYCSKECQTQDWPMHKLVCRAFTKSTCMYRDPPAPSSMFLTYRRALLFRPDHTCPCFMFLKYHKDGKPVGLHDYFPDTPPGDVKTIAFHDRFLPYWIQLSYDSNPKSERELAVNEAIGEAFRGPVVAIAYDAEEGLSAPALDADTTTLRPVIEYARLRAEYDGPVFVEQPQVRCTKEEWVEIREKSLNGANGVV
ncbi:hypothetical protein CC86DRAFT_428592 [Ophiobolus disseminans]|uniref:MYND-type domain-containing protein n=1 Tax=Ophiobolus disseminans TaxID=1469910 RepID=A0A6A6ZK83_9PLEO|nr:hypothetical protein CC86DRAFT_428592 [Ophiobolus disseminans]